MSVKIFSSLEKCFLDEDFSNKQVYAKGSCLLTSARGDGLVNDQKIVSRIGELE